MKYRAITLNIRILSRLVDNMFDFASSTMDGGGCIIEISARERGRIE